MRRKPIRKITFYFLYFVVVGSLILIILEVAAAVLLEKRMDNQLSIFEGILQSNQNILEISPFYDAEWKTQEFHISVRTNSRGYREDFDFEDSSVEVAFMGDSFCFGHGIDVHSRYSNVAARSHPKIKIVSLSYNNGFQPEHYEYFLDRHPDLRPKILFVNLYLGNDLDSDLNETLIERDNNGKIRKLQLPFRKVYRGTMINRPNYRYDWLSRLVKATSLGKILAVKINSSYRLRRIFSKDQSLLPNTGNRLSTELGNLDQHNFRAIRSLRKIAQAIEIKNGELHILLIPQNFLVGNVQRPHVAPENMHRVDEFKSKNGLMKAILNLCENEGLKCHDLSRILTSDDYFKEDAHWNEDGHEKVGKYTSEFIAKIMIQK